jgi:hypothetical protein
LGDFARFNDRQMHVLLDVLVRMLAASKGWQLVVANGLPPEHGFGGCVGFRLALTEDRPTIKNYDRARWAELSDAKTAEVELSLRLLESLHARWVVFLRTLTDGEERADLLPSGTSARSSTR